MIRVLPQPPPINKHRNMVSFFGNIPCAEAGKASQADCIRSLRSLPRNPTGLYSGSLPQPNTSDEHYIKSKTYWQRLAQRIAVPRVIGATCLRIDVDEGEENARYKLALFGLTRCPGRGACADPVALSGSSLAPDADGLARFRTAWKARRAQLEVEARKADAKIEIMKKLPVLCDCATFRCQEGMKYSADVLLLCQVVYSGFERRHAMGAPYFYSTVAWIGAYCDCTPIFAPEQLHLSEFVAHRTRDMVFIRCILLPIQFHLSVLLGQSLLQ